MNFMRSMVLLLALIPVLPVVVSAQDLDPKDVRIPLEQAFPIAIKKAREDFADLQDYLLYSVHPRALLGDPKGLFWQFTWQEKVFPHRKRLRVRVYVGDGSASSERIADGR